MMINEKQILGHLQENPTSQQLHVFGKHKFEYRCLIFHKNSPLVPMFEQGVSHFRERGVEHELQTKWFGKWMENKDVVSGNMLTLGQLGLIFIIMAAIYIICLTGLCGEIMFQWLKKLKMVSFYQYVVSFIQFTTESGLCRLTEGQPRHPSPRPSENRMSMTSGCSHA